LALSTSIPAIEFEECNIFFIKDEGMFTCVLPTGLLLTLSVVVGKDPKPPAELVLTDGCGLMNGSAMSRIGQHCNLAARPTGTQGRVAGSKGLWILHPSDRSPTEPPRIWIRESQRKIFLQELKRWHRVFDLVATARVATPRQLSQQSIINLAHGGVPSSVFKDLMREDLQRETERLTQWDVEAPVLWDAIYRAGGVSGCRLQQHTKGMGRALGVAGRSFRHEGEKENDDGNAGAAAERESAPDGDFHHIQSSLYESALQLVQAGFRPLECKPLNDKLQRILEFAIRSCVREYRFTLPGSAGAFLAPGMSQLNRRILLPADLLQILLECSKKEKSFFNRPSR
jgi:RNA-dependent RNA polymerase